VPGPSWRFDYRPSAALPPLFWVARISSSLIEVACGSAVRCTPEGFFEGTWVGPPELTAAAGASTVFGTGILVGTDGPVVVNPSHSQEGVYAARDGGATVVSNSLAGLLVRLNRRLDPRADYPSTTVVVADLKWLIEEGRPPRVRGSAVSIPTSGEPVVAHFCENLLVDAAGSLSLSPKRRERTFASFADYRDRLTEAVAQLFANGAPYEPVVALSAGYDSTAVAAVAATAGLRRAVGFATARQEHGGEPVDDTGSAAAKTLGLEYELYERMSYLERDDLPEAEFLAGGMSGEDVIMSAFERPLKGSLLLTGHWGGLLWAERSTHAPHDPRRLPQADLSGCSMTDFRLRADFLHVPLPFFGATQAPAYSEFQFSDEMAPYRLGGKYDRPVPRRLAEEAGVPREAFGRRKAAVGALIHRDPGAALSRATLADVERFARDEGDEGDEAIWRPTFRTRRRHRALIQGAHRVGLGRLAAGTEARRRSGVHFVQRTGSVLFRWALEATAPRYSASD